MEVETETISVPGFGFYSPDIWSAFDAARKINGGNYSDEEVCGIMGVAWDLKRTYDDDTACRPQWDGVAACVPSSPAGQLAQLPCMAEYQGKFFNTSYNITKKCMEDGSWNNYTDYTQCLKHRINVTLEIEEVTEWEIFIFLLGYTVSICALVVAIFIFLYFREIRFLRHKIHLNLFLSLLTANLDWVLIYAVEHPDNTEILSTLNCILHVLLRYFHLTNFFWMFVEGLYLFLQVQASFSVGNMKLRHCVGLGWGAPFLITLIWTVLVFCHEQSPESLDLGPISCPFMSKPRDLELVAYMVPVCLILLCNTIFLVWIMVVVVSKLRPSEHHQQTQNVNLRAAKALIIIVPLLGITYLVTIVGPSEPESTWETIFILTRNVLLSFQGFIISLLYCFLNGEICLVIKNHWTRWWMIKEIGNTQKYTKTTGNLESSRSQNQRMLAAENQKMRMTPSCNNSTELSLLTCR